MAIYHANTEEEVISIAERARESIFQLDIEHRENLPYQRVTTSIGIAVFDAKSELSSDILYNHADIALYQAKENGRNQLVVFKKMEDTND